MTSLLLETAIAVTAASAGAAAGWCFRRSRESKCATSTAAGAVAQAAVEQEAQNNRQAAKDLLSQVHGLTSKVATQVGEHNLRVQAINDQLAEGGEKQDIQSVTGAINRLVEANAWMQQQLASAESKLESQARLIESHVNEARTDALTGIANRRAFDEEMQRCLSALRLQQVPACVMMIDVDHFKKFNDTHGHKAGDEVLRHVAASLKQAAGASGVVCRYGGEEFAVIFPQQKAAAVTPLAERCRAAIGGQSIAYEGKTLNVNASAGLAEFGARDTMETVLERADEALYASKRGGRNCGHLHDGQDFVPFLNPASQAKTRQAQAKPAMPQMPGVDQPTGLSTRAALEADLQQQLSALGGTNQPLSLMIVQLDQLREWKEKGGQEGEMVAIRKVAQAIRTVMAGRKDHLARFDEASFGILLKTSNLGEAVDVALKLRCELQASQPRLDGLPIALTLSIGISEAMAGDDVGKIIRRAQQAVSATAPCCGNQIAIHDGIAPSVVDEALSV